MEEGDATTILDLFDRMVARHPDACALDIPPAHGRARETRTYAELAAMARAAATAIAQQRARDAREPVVALALGRGDPWLYASMLGAMRARCAYVAIDPAFPAAQAAEILRDAEAIALVATPARAAEIAALRGAAEAPALLAPETLAATPGSAQPPSIDPRSLAYLIYTSGTTGKPKGVEIEHASILNLVRADMPEYGLGVGDRVAQGSSAAYDSSVEEIWLAWASGATVVAMDDETARLGPDLVPWLVRERITVLCPPPTLLRTLACDDPRATLPAIRLLYVGGEALPQDLADLWSQGRRLENGYGPTECTVTCLRGRVRAGEPVTIGTPVPGATAFVVDPDAPGLPTVSDGTQGELVVGGACLARGYRGQPETTAARFIDHPTLGRVYRTGDLVHRDARGDFHYHGRIDAQVKLRGYRIELGAVEARLAAHPSVLEAACTVEGEGIARRLVAHAVARDGAAIDADTLREFVASALPPYMVPTAIAPIAAIPRTIGGKIDRRRLPAIGDAQQPDAPFVAPATATEEAVARAIAGAVGRAEISVEADFFDDLGLDSLTVAIAISRMRGDDRTRAATVRLAYAHRTARAVAAALDEAPLVPTAARRAHAPGPAQGTSHPLAVTLAQTAFLAALLVVASQALWIPSAGAFLADALGGSLAGLVLVAAAAAGAVALYTLATVVIAVAAKWILIGRYRAGRHAAWSWWHFRHWATVRLVSLAPWELLETLSLAPAMLRLLGARIGRRVHIHRGVRLGDGGWDLVELEDDATIGQDASLRPVDLEAGAIVCGPVIVRAAATLETRAGMSPGAELGPRSILRALANLEAGEAHADAILDGIPAERTGTAPPLPPTPEATFEPARLAVAAIALAGIVAALALPWLVAMEVVGLRADASFHDLLFPDPNSILPAPGAIGLLLATTALAGIGTVAMQAILARLCGRPPVGRHSLRSIAALRMNLQSALVEGAGKWLSGTLMWPIWLRLAGARIGRGCEISTVTDVVPSLVEIGDETFFADGIYLGGPTLRAGAATALPVALGRSNFVGNHAVLPGGTRLAEGTLVGISTRGDELPHEDGQSWFGHPPFRLPKREIVEMPRTLTHDPPLLRRINRWAWEVARFLLPAGPLVVGFAWFRAMELAEESLSTTAFRLVALPLGTLAAVATLALAIVAMKWLLIGRVRPGTHALWSCWCSRWDFLYVAWGMWASVPLGFLEGTLLLVGYLRAMGCRIGRRALLGHGFAHVVDPDMLRFGDEVTVQALFQAHTFEDRVLKIDHVDIRDGATVGANAVVLYGADIGKGAVVAPHSVVMKREHLPGGMRHAGAPTRPV